MSAPDRQVPAPSKSDAILARLESGGSSSSSSCPGVGQGVELRLQTVSLFDDLGFAVLPLNGKAPIEKGWTSKARPSREQAEDYARRGNIGVRTGSASGGLVIADVDEETPEWRAVASKLPETWTVRTGSGGEHRYFRAPAGVHVPNSNKKAIPGVDILSDGKQAAAPGNVHPGTGRLYEWVPGRSPADLEGPAELPSFVIDLIHESKASVPSDVVPVPSDEEAEARDAALSPEDRERVQSVVLGLFRSDVERVRDAAPLTSQNTYYAACCNVGNYLAGGVVTEEEASEQLEALVSAAGERGVEGIEATLDSGMGMGASKPKYAFQVLAEIEEKDAKLERQLGGLWSESRAAKATAPGEATVRAERKKRLAEAWEAVNAELTPAVQAGSAEPLLALRREFGLLALYDKQAIAQFKQLLKEHRTDMGGYTLGAFEDYLKDVKREVADQEADAEIERQAALDPRPMIQASADPLSVVYQSRDALIALNERSANPIVYMRGGMPVMVTPAGSTTSVGQGELGYLLAQSARFIRKTAEGSIVPVEPSAHLIRNLHASLPFSSGLPVLNAVWRVPTMTTSGHVIRDGYDAETGFLVITDLAVSIGETREDARDAVAFIDEHIFGRGARSGIPFESDADRANALGMLITASLRSTIGGLSPLFIVTAPGQSNGKSTLAKVAQVVPSGTSESDKWPNDDLVLERDHLVPAFNEARPVVVFDNVTNVVNSAVLAKVATDEEFSFRKFREQFSVRGKNNLVVVLTGNNLRFGSDFRRRTATINLNAKCVNPDSRTGFRHPDLLEWVRANRAEVLSALMTIARAWFAAGQPEATVPTLGSYGEWSRVVGGMLEFAGVNGFLRNLRSNQEADQQGVEAEALLRFLAEAYSDQPFTSRNVCEKHLRVVTDSLGSYFKPNDLSNNATITKKLGEVLNEIKGRRFGSDEDCIWIERATDERGRVRRDARNTALWILRREVL